MPNLHTLAGKTRLASATSPEAIVANTPDGDDARTVAIARLTRFVGVLEAERTIVEAIDVRIKLRPPVAQPQTLQDLVRAGRRRLERERVGRRQHWIGGRLDAIGRLREALRP